MIRAPFAHDPKTYIEAEHADIELSLDDAEELEGAQEAQGMMANITLRDFRYRKPTNSSHRHQVPYRKPRGTPRTHNSQDLSIIREHSEICGFSEELE